jgi:AcrR family transcriptional regulator
MPRVVNEEDYAARRKDILDVARQLVYTKGYEQMSIQDILDALKISKGAFYHYFDSKQALLDGLVEQMLDEADQLMSPILEAKDLPALEKMKRYFDTGSRWKADQKDFLRNLMRVWYNDANALIRQKQETAIMRYFAPKLAGIIRQGIEEGSFTTKYPDQFADTMLGLSRGLEDKIVGLLLAERPPPNALEQLEAIIGAYSDSLERILGAPSGSLQLNNMDTLKKWVSTN